MEKYNTEKEIWKDIEGYEGYYQVSNLGRVRSLDRTIESEHRSPQFMKGNIKKVIRRDDGYEYVVLYRDNKGKNKYVHRLVAKAFVPNPNKLPIINHIDENPSNNLPSNLEWCDHQYNLTYGDKVERVTNSKGYKERTKRLQKPIYVIDKNGNRKRYESITSACNELDLHYSNVHKSLTGKKYPTYKGYTFEYA